MIFAPSRKLKHFVTHPGFRCFRCRTESVRTSHPSGSRQLNEVISSAFIRPLALPPQKTFGSLPRSSLWRLLGRERVKSPLDYMLAGFAGIGSEVSGDEGQINAREMGEA